MQVLKAARCGTPDASIKPRGLLLTLLLKVAGKITIDKTAFNLNFKEIQFWTLNKGCKNIKKQQS
jgi:hypothetical protein